MGLRLNTKTRLFWLEDDEDRNDLLHNLKRVSQDYQVPEDEDERSPQVRFDEILNALNKLKQARLDPSFSLRRQVDTEVLKELYAKDVAQIIRKKSNVAKIRRLFRDFNYDLVSAQPREIMVMLLVDTLAAQAFKEYLLRKKALNSRDANLVLTYLCQTGFESKELMALLSTSHTMRAITVVFEQGVESLSEPGYFGLSQEQVQMLASNHHVIEQIRLRRLAEQQGQYSIALNHLLNEVHAISLQLDDSRVHPERYRADDVVEFMRRKRVPQEHCINVRNLFDRRNKTPVSHADPNAWPVSQDEYTNFRFHVGRCLSYLLN